MSANVETMMYAGDVPWHGIGTAVDGEQTAENAIRAAGLDWSVSLKPVFSEVTPQVPAGAIVPASFGAINILPTRIAVPGYRAVVRDSDSSPLGIVGERYRPVQNRAAFNFFDGVVGEGQAIYHTAGSLDDGRRVWILAKLPGAVKVLGGDVDKFLLLANAHDGSAALRMLFTPVRVVCSNTLGMALSGGAKEGISIRHTQSISDKIREAQRALGMAARYYGQFEQLANVLARTRYTEMPGLVERLFPVQDGVTEVPTRTANNREKVLALFDHGRGHEPIRGTAWAAYNAVAEYTDHERGSSKQTPSARASSVWFGSGAAMKADALDMILSDTGVYQAAA